MLYFIVKANIILALLCLLFQVLMYRDTFFGIRRAMLLGIYAVAMLLPLWNVEAWTSAQGGAEMTEAYASYVLPTLEVTTNNILFLGIHQEEPGCGMWQVAILLLWGILYLIPVVWLTAKLLWQIIYIMYLRFTCPAEMVMGQRIYRYPRSCSPFSFGPWIFLPSEEINEYELREVLVHEQTHVGQWHTLDILLAQLFCIVFWWNPAVWVLRREVRLNLEFIADGAVVGKEVDRRAYQYHLLGFASQMNVATITNNFNVLPLKRRIVMMNARRTHRMGMLKYAFFVPVAAGMLLLCNVDAKARMMAGEISTSVAQADSVYAKPEVMPEYPGGAEALYRELSMNVRYPQLAIENGISGRVVVGFVVEPDGSISDVKVVHDSLTKLATADELTVMAKQPDEKAEKKVSEEEIHQAMKDEALRVVKGLKDKWKPGTVNGKAVRVRFGLPIAFRLSDCGSR